MQLDDLLRQAWEAVQKAGIPEPLQPVAFSQAFDYLSRDGGDHSAASSAKPRLSAASHKKVAHKPQEADDSPKVTADPDLFFATLAAESGEAEVDLRDILQVTSEGNVTVMTPTKDLGSNKSDQAKTVIALVAGGRAIGLGENPVKAEAVRQELQRKHCYDRPNFAVYHLGKLRGFNAGSDKSQIVLTSKWVDEFGAAVARAHGRKPAKNES
jgi:hypothetical protein